MISSSLSLSPQPQQLLEAADVSALSQSTLLPLSAALSPSPTPTPSSSLQTLVFCDGLMPAGRRATREADIRYRMLDVLELLPSFSGRFPSLTALQLDQCDGWTQELAEEMDVVGALPSLTALHLLQPNTALLSSLYTSYAAPLLPHLTSASVRLSWTRMESGLEDALVNALLGFVVAYSGQLVSLDIAVESEHSSCHQLLPAVFSCSSLTALSIAGNVVEDFFQDWTGDEELPHAALPPLQCLHSLTVARTSLEDRELRAILSSCPAVTHCRLGPLLTLTEFGLMEEAMVTIGWRLTRLKALRFDGCLPTFPLNPYHVHCTQTVHASLCLEAAAGAERSSVPISYAARMPTAQSQSAQPQSPCFALFPNLESVQLYRQQRDREPALAEYVSAAAAFLALTAPQLARLHILSGWMRGDTEAAEPPLTWPDLHPLHTLTRLTSLTGVSDINALPPALRQYVRHGDRDGDDSSSSSWLADVTADRSSLQRLFSNESAASVGFEASAAEWDTAEQRRIRRIWEQGKYRSMVFREGSNSRADFFDTLASMRQQVHSI